MTELIPKIWGRDFRLLNCHPKLNKCPQSILRQINFPLNGLFYLLHLLSFPWVLSGWANNFRYTCMMET